jgi:nucleoside-diphosphate-sugar epimerase
VARAFVGALGNPKAYGRGYHATGEEWLTWDAYHQIVANALGAPPPTLVHIATDLLGQVVPKEAEWCVENFHYNNLFDNAAARADLGFQYTIPFAEGARRTIAWQEAHGGFQDSDEAPFYDAILDAWGRLGAKMARELGTGGKL